MGRATRRHPRLPRADLLSGDGEVGKEAAVVFAKGRGDAEALVDLSGERMTVLSIFSQQEGRARPGLCVAVFSSMPVSGGVSGARRV